MRPIGPVIHKSIFPNDFQVNKRNSIQGRNFTGKLNANKKRINFS